ncbi:MAG: S8 family serine peptidase [Pseudomonadota bacterium]
MSLPKKSRVASVVIGILGMLSANAHAQQVALIDSGVDPNAGFNIAPGFNYFNNTDDTSDVSDREEEGHGTISARVVTEAFSGEIVPFVITDGVTSVRLVEDQVRVARDSALSDILGRDAVRVVGITWGTSGVVGAAASLLPELSNNNKVIAIMAGNDEMAQPNALSSASFNLSGVIIVGATDADGVLLPLANRAGTTANKYVAAIGLPTLDAELGGSSWAAARIAGIAGAVLQQNPDLTASEVVDVILQSAEDRGATGTDNEYGRGVILSADQVLNNVIGPVTVPTTPTPPPTTNTGGGGGGGGGGAGLLVGAALAGALVLLRKPKAKLEKTLVLDSYGRAFEIDLSDRVAVNDGSLHLNEFFHALEQTSVGDEFYLPKLKTSVAFAATTEADQRIDMIEYWGTPGDVVLENDQANVSMALYSQLTDQFDFTAGYRVSPSQAFGAVSQLDSHEVFGPSSFISGQAFSSVLSGFSSQAETASLAYQPKVLDKASLKMGLVSVDQKQRFGQDTFSSILEGSYQFTDNAGLSLQFGQIEEKGSLFGGAAGGVFGVETATTYALNVSGRIKTTDRVSIVANYGVGKTKVESATDSLLEDFSSLRSDWYSVGLIANDMLRDRDQFGMAFSQPLKIRSGGVNYSIPNGREINGDISFDRERINLSDTGATERSLEAYYRTMVSEKLELGSFVAYRQNPNHVAEDGDELLFMATLRYRQ